MDFKQHIFSLLIGALLTGGSGFAVWKAQAYSAYETDVKNRREELIVETADILSRAGRVRGLINAQILQVAASKRISTICLSAYFKNKEIEDCKNNTNYQLMNDFNKEIIDSNAKFIKLTSLIPIYYCKKTKELFQKIKKEHDWWNITPDQTLSILKTMHLEYECNL